MRGPSRRREQSRGRGGDAGELHLKNGTSLRYLHVVISSDVTHEDEVNSRQAQRVLYTAR